MPYKNVGFEHYRLLHHTADQAVKPDIRAVIGCYQANKIVGWIYFLKDDARLPPPTINSKGLIVLHYSIRHFKDIIDTIRYEKPLYLSVNTSMRQGCVKTTSEPVGEEET